MNLKDQSLLLLNINTQTTVTLSAAFTGTKGFTILKPSRYYLSLYLPGAVAFIG